MMQTTYSIIESQYPHPCYETTELFKSNTYNVCLLICYQKLALRLPPGLLHMNLHHDIILPEVHTQSSNEQEALAQSQRTHIFKGQLPPHSNNLLDQSTKMLHYLHGAKASFQGVPRMLVLNTVPVHLCDKEATSHMQQIGLSSLWCHV
jgi:hypothetical protein